MAELRGSRTEANLRHALAAESIASRRYLFFAQKADVEGQPEAAALFRSIAEGETGHAFGHLEFLSELGDPVTRQPLDSTEDNLKSAIASETLEYTEMYPSFSEIARDEGFSEIAEWLESLVRAEKGHAERLSDGLSSLT
ncbi:MAG: rubrerythrin [Acidimicrobiales bacterium]